MHARNATIRSEVVSPLTHLEPGPKPATPVRQGVLRFIISHLPHNVEGACPLVCKHKRWFVFDLSFSKRQAVGDLPRAVWLRGMECVSQVYIRKGGDILLSTIFYNGNQIRRSIRNLSNKGTQFDCDLHSRTSHFASISDKYVFLTPI